MYKQKNVPYGTYTINGGEHEIRTHGSFHYATFPRWCLKPLGQLSKVTSIILLIFKEMSTINCIISYFFVCSKYTGNNRQSYVCAIGIPVPSLNVFFVRCFVLGQHWKSRYDKSIYAVLQTTLSSMKFLHTRAGSCKRANRRSLFPVKKQKLIKASVSYWSWRRLRFALNSFCSGALSLLTTQTSSVFFS